MSGHRKLRAARSLVVCALLSLATLAGCGESLTPPACDCGIGYSCCPGSNACVPSYESCTRPDLAPPPGDMARSDGGSVTSTPFVATPATLDFGSVLTGSSGSLTTQLVNNSLQYQYVDQIQIVGTDADQFTLVMNGCETAYAEFDSCGLTVFYQPTRAGTVQARVSVLSAGSELGSVKLTASPRDGVPKLSVSPAGSFAFLPTPLNGPPGYLQVEIGNSGDGSGHVTAALAGDSAFVLGAAANCNPLTPSGSCAFSITFTPTVEVPYQATLTLFDGGVAFATLSLSGSGSDPATLSISGSAALPNVFLGDPPATVQLFHVKNADSDSSGTITTSMIGANAADFAIVSDGCNGVALGGASSCDIGVRFTPSLRSYETAQLSVASPSGGSPSMVLYSYGRQHARLTLSAGNGHFGNVSATPVSRQVTIFNDADEATAAIGSVLAGGASSSFSVAQPLDYCTNQPLQAGSHCTMTLLFSPFTVGARSDTLTLTAAPSSPLAIPIDANYASSTLLLATPTLGLGTNVTSPRSISYPIRNISNGPVGPLVVDFTPLEGFTIDGGCAGVTLAAGASCIIQVTFTPSFSGSFSASVAVHAGSDPATSVTTQLSATALMPAFSFSPAVAEFGNVGIGQASAPLTVTVTNVSNRPQPTDSYLVSGDGDFEVASTACPATLDVGASCDVTLRFEPRAGGSDSDTLSFYTAEGAPALSLHGTAN
jgi:hypothetical protein